MTTKDFNTLSEMLNISNVLLSEITAFRTYSKFLKYQSRRETLDETINRSMSMHLERFPRISKDIVKAFQRVHDRKVVGSMRGMQFAGDAITKNNARIFNCSYAPIEDVRVFSEGLFLLLSGVGFGFSVQKHHVSKLPKVKMPREEGVMPIHDSIQGWSEALNTLLEAYFNAKIRPVFDYSLIRLKGSYLVTTGAKAPGPDSLKVMLNAVEAKLKLAIGRQLRPLEVHDIICLISEAVLAGGIRRAALISLFDSDDQEMLTCKSGTWWEKHPYRARANNSANLHRGRTSKKQFMDIYEMCQKSGAGEPGIKWTNDDDMNLGSNPCNEISLKPYQFCNLTSISQTGIKDQRDFMNRVYAATLIGTLQASYTDFHYLSERWQRVTEEEALLGVSFTGIADGAGLSSNELRAGAEFSLDVNEKYARKIGTNLAARVTTVKPEGSSSCVLASSSGIHARHAEYYIRRIRMNKNDALSNYLKSTIPELVEDDQFSANGVVVSLPQQSPKGSIIRHNETAMTLFDRTMLYNKNWVKPGHRSGVDQHNVSVTISVKEDEWDGIGKAMWDNRQYYGGISLLPFDAGTYVQAPFEDCTKEKYEEMMSKVKEIDLTKVREEEDNTTRAEQLACAGGLCVIE